jgi:hypothetical protein
MNLFYQPTLSQLSRLIAANANYHQRYDLIIDHDGEVLLEVSSLKPLNRYKFYIRGLTGKEQIGILASRNLRYINQLYKNLVYCWENKITGAIDYEEISLKQTLHFWLEMNRITPKEIHKAGRALSLR